MNDELYAALMNLISRLPKGLKEQTKALVEASKLKDSASGDGGGVKAYFAARRAKVYYRVAYQGEDGATLGAVYVRTAEALAKFLDVAESTVKISTVGGKIYTYTRGAKVSPTVRAAAPTAPSPAHYGRPMSFFEQTDMTVAVRLPDGTIVPDDKLEVALPIEEERRLLIEHAISIPEHDHQRVGLGLVVPGGLPEAPPPARSKRHKGS